MKSQKLLLERIKDSQARMWNLWQVGRKIDNDSPEFSKAKQEAYSEHDAIMLEIRNNKKKTK